jgi:excisionase family DNA binding protein
MISKNDRFPDPSKLLLSSREAAKVLSISERSLWTLTKNGEIPFVKIGACKRYTLSDLMEFVDRNKRIHEPLGGSDKQISL